MKPFGIIVVLMVASVTYIGWGAPSHLTAYNKMKTMEQRVTSLLSTPQLSLEQLNATLKELEDVAAKESYAWERLGQYYQQLHQDDKAAMAFAKALEYSSDPRFILAKVNHEATTHEGRLSPESLGLLATFLSHYPNHPGAVNLLAVDAYQRLDYKQAIAYWQSVLHEPNTEALRDPMMEAIEKARVALIESNQIKGPWVKIELKGPQPEGLSLFVSLKRANEPLGMPLWAQKVLGAQNHIYLSTLHAMAAKSSLEKGERVVVSAKLTDGTATDAGQTISSAPFALSEKTVLSLNFKEQRITIKKS